MVRGELKLNRAPTLCRNLKDYVGEIFIIAKSCFASVWFWIPVLFQAYMIFQLWLVFFVHPLTLLILPAILTTYLLWRAEKRVEARYGLKMKLSSYSIGTNVESRSKGELALYEYEKMIKRKMEDKEDEK